MANPAPVQRTHTDISPSSADRWMNCPGSVALCAKMPKPEQSKYAGEGEAAHDLAERCLRNPKIVPFDLVGEEINGFPVTEEMAEAVCIYRETILTELAKGGQLIIEQKVDIAPGVSGRLDAAIVRPFKEVIAFDFKYGKGVLVSAQENPQLIMYALPLALQYEVTEITCVIIQPRTEDQISRWSCDMDYLSTFADEMTRKIALTKDPGAPTASGSWCKWCWAKPICPALRQNISDMLPAIPGKELLLPDVKGLPIPVLVRILDSMPLLESWLGACAAYAQEVAEMGGEVPGYELAKKRANRRWINENEAIASFSDLAEKAYTLKLNSPAAMEKLVGKERVAPLTEVPDNGMTLKKITEKSTAKKIKELL
jgi:hypothetical protein